MPSGALFLLFAGLAVGLLQAIETDRLARRAAAAAVCIVAAAVTAIVAIATFAPDPDRFAQTRLTERATAAANAVAEADPATTLILVVGASRSHFGLRKDVLEQALAAQGRHSTVVKLTLPGADTFQRLEMLRVLARHLPEGSASAFRVVVLFELQENYDTLPLTFWRELRQAWTPEALQSTDVHNAALVVASYLGSSQVRDTGTFITLLGHIAANATGAGRLAPTPAGRDEPRPRNLRLIEPPALDSRPAANAAVVKQALAGFATDLAAEEARQPVAFTGWKRDLVEPLMLGALPFDDLRIGYFNTPSLKAGDYRHARTWCASLDGAACLYFGRVDWLADAQFAHERNWRDPGHMLSEVSTAWTLWLAGRLAGSGLMGSPLRP
ncbi:MAG: hypothetical protein NW205_12020 [Hyphomicrobiaceae bacterium]|nr:hypothetical protein [Hyphomicrobiaceae bacterium]